MALLRSTKAVRKALPVLLPSYQIVHVCGKGKVDTSIKNVDGYIQFDYVKQELSDLLAAADLVISVPAPMPSASFWH